MKLNFYCFSSSFVLKKRLFFIFSLIFFTSFLWGQSPFVDNTPTPGPKTWTVPAGVTSIKAEVWGGGGSGGGSSTGGRSGSGGGGGGYSSATFTVFSGQSISYIVGAGGASGGNGNNGIDGIASLLTHAPSGTSLTGNGGKKGNAESSVGGAGGTATGTAGSTNIPGGTGGAGNSSTGGNGGDGGNAPGTGGAGQSDNHGSPGIIPGGGGGGGERGNKDRAGGAGANGQIILTYIAVTAVTPSPVCVGSTITITGTNFATGGSTTVSINGIACTSVTVVNSTTITAVVANGTTSGTVLVTNPNGTNNGKSITVNPLPTAVTVTGTTPACTSTTLTASNGGSGTIYWQNTTSNGTSTATPSTSQVVTVSGTYYFRALSAGGCWGPEGSITVVVGSPPAAIAGGATAVCVGAATPAFTNSTSGGVWSIINGTGTASITSGGVVTGLTAGNVTVAYTVGSCPAVTKSLTVNAAPAAIAGGASTVCVGSTTPAFTNSVGGGTWSITNGTGSATITTGGVVTGGSAGSATVTYTIGTCSVSMPITVITATAVTSNPSSVSVAVGANTSFTVVASNTPTSYTWQVSTDGGASWANVSNGGVYSNATTATLNITGATFGMNGYLYRASATNACGTSAYSSNAMLTLNYCTPTSSNPSSLYINSFQFVGVLNNPPANTQSGTAAYSSGYQNYTSFTPMAQQPQNTALNITAKTNGSSGGSWKAWVDWNRDGDFNDAGEEIYKMTTYTTPSIAFGIVIPSSALGIYRLRIGTSNTSASNGSYDFTACTNIIGEYEDYLFEVLADCAAKVVSVNNVNSFDGERCGPGSVRISATGNASAVNYKWYDSVYGGTLLGTGNTYYTPSISSTTTYYVTAVSSSGCETAYRYPVEARIDPNPTVTFSTSQTAICGEDVPSLLVTASGDKYQDVYFEKFDTGLGVFNNVTSGAYTNSLGFWMNKLSPYIPTVAEGYAGTSPALSSGYFGGNYAMINSDISRSTSVLNHLVSNNFDVSGFLNLKVDFDMYHFSIAADDTQGYVNVDYSLDGGTTWVNLTHFFNDVGNPFNWQKFSFNIPGGPFTSTQFKLRFTHFSKAQSSPNVVFYEAITTVDNVRIYGFKTINTPFNWSSAATTIYDTDCTTVLPGSTLKSTVCIKPTPTEKENLNWSINANATFSNGCPAIGSFAVANDTKTWEQPGFTDWNLAAQWKPVNAPDINKCVIIKTPVDLPTGTSGTHGQARSIIVKSGGKLTVNPKSSLTIQNYIKNEAAVTDVIVESDANLVQNNNAAVNSGNITIRRNTNLKRLDYNYWGSPVVGQNVKAFSPGTLDTRFYVYNESNDYFDGLFIRNLYPDNVTYSLTPTVSASTYNFISGKGYAIRASNTLSSTTTTNVVGEFKGVPFNGIVDVPLVKSATGDGYNLISNPYPSTIDFYALYNYNYNSGANKNSDLIYNTAYFWTNINPNPKMQGANYPSKLGTNTYINNYAVLNGTGGVSPSYGFNGTGVLTPAAMVPVQYIKPGQGFLVKAKTNGNLRFENGASIRTNNQTGVFFNRVSSVASKDRFWLNLKTPLDFVSPILVGYINGATDNYDEDFDAELFIVGGDSFYSSLDGKKLAIQGKKYPLDTNDVISLGAVFGLDGQYEIALGAKEGIFASQQPIYILDKVTGVYADLTNAAYIFTASTGYVEDRFEIHYTMSTLGTKTMNADGIKVYRNSGKIFADAPMDMQKISIVDASGKLIYSHLANSKKIEIDEHNFISGVYYVILEMNGKIITKKIIK